MSFVLRPLPAFTAILALLLPPPGQSLAPFATTPEDVVERMLVLARTTARDVVYDLGSGDGRIPILAARRYGARGVGIELNRSLVDEARMRAETAGVAGLVEFRNEDALAADISDATVITLYILASGNARLLPRLKSQLRPGTRIVSHAFSMGKDWPADTIDHFVSAAGDEVTLYLWTVK
jgi:cyclopropane fatty-acyl-phospholipid synthase-like methyltransferase